MIACRHFQLRALDVLRDNLNVVLIHHLNELQRGSKHRDANRSFVLSLTPPSRLEEVTKQLNAIQKSLGSLTSGTIITGERSSISVNYHISKPLVSIN